VEDARVVHRSSALALDQRAALAEVELDASKDLEVLDLGAEILIVDVELPVSIARAGEEGEALIPDQIFGIARDRETIEVAIAVVFIDIREHCIAAQRHGEIGRGVEPAPGRELDTILILPVRPIGIVIGSGCAKGDGIIEIEFTEEPDAKYIDIRRLDIL